MSTRTAARSRTTTRSKPRKRRAKVLRRRVLLLLAAAATTLLVVSAVLPLFDKAVQELALPLKHEDVIRQQAADKGLDASLIAAVIYTESRFRDATSPVGAKGLMQIMPTTADYIARKSGGTEFERGDLAKPQINIAYGSWYLRYLLRKYGGNETFALAAYNAGEGKVDEWVGRGPGFEIPFTETREYVDKVKDARKQYRAQYARELGL